MLTITLCCPLFPCMASYFSCYLNSFLLFVGFSRWPVNRWLTTLLRRGEFKHFVLVSEITFPCDFHPRHRKFLHIFSFLFPNPNPKPFRTCNQCTITIKKTLEKNVRVFLPTLYGRIGLEAALTSFMCWSGVNLNWLETSNNFRSPWNKINEHFTFIAYMIMTRVRSPDMSIKIRLKLLICVTWICEDNITNNELKQCCFVISLRIAEVLEVHDATVRLSSFRAKLATPRLWY